MPMKPIREMTRILCRRLPDREWISSDRMSRERAQSTIIQIEGEHAADPTKGCPGPHEIVPA